MKVGKVDRGRDDLLGDCILWTKALNKGYGAVSVGGRRMYAHRVEYEKRHGPLPRGMELDHLCRQKACINPDHLEPVTHAENMRRWHALKPPRQVCRRGHPYTDENTYIDPAGKRKCRACNAFQGRAARRRTQQLSMPPAGTGPCVYPSGRPTTAYVHRTVGGRRVLAHRVAYEQAYGPIAAGMEIDHLCNDRGCVNPAHLEAVSHADNIRRSHALYVPLRTTCKRGHPFTPENTYVRPGKGRSCRQCTRDAQRRWDEAQQGRT